MKILADMGVSQSTVSLLKENGHEVKHVRDEGMYKSSDLEILLKARREKRVVLTFDLDFGDLLKVGSHKLPSVIIFRLRIQTPAAIARTLPQVLKDRSKELGAGAIIIIEDDRYRVRRLPLTKKTRNRR